MLRVFQLEPIMNLSVGVSISQIQEILTNSNSADKSGQPNLRRYLDVWCLATFGSNLFVCGRVMKHKNDMRLTADLELHLIVLLVLGSNVTVATAANQQNPLILCRGRVNSPYLLPKTLVEAPVNWLDSADFRSYKQAAKDRVTSMSLIYGDSQHLSTSSKYAAEKLFRTAVQKHAGSDLTGAIADYLAAIRIYDKEPAVHWYLGTAYEAAGKTTEAKQEFGKEQAMKETFTTPGLRSRYSGGYGSGTGAGYGGGDFGSSKLKFVPGQGLTKDQSLILPR
jgi:hypothetical protein